MDDPDGIILELFLGMRSQEPATLVERLICNKCQCCCKFNRLRWLCHNNQLESNHMSKEMQQVLRTIVLDDACVLLGRLAEGHKASPSQVSAHPHWYSGRGNNPTLAALCPN